MPANAETVRYARNLIARGYKVIPVNVTVDREGRKFPQFRNGTWHTIDDANDVPSAWDGFEGIAVNTELSGLVVVDVDVTGGKDGHVALAAARITLPETPVMVRTRSGGTHYYYRAAETPVRTSVGVLAPGVDIRATAGIAFAPPTMVGEGEYSFVGNVVPVEQLPVFPADLVDRLNTKDSSGTISVVGDVPPVTPPQREALRRKLDLKINDLARLDDGRIGWGQRTLPRIFGIAKTVGEDLEAVADLIRDAYHESGGDQSDKFDSLIGWAMAHSRPEQPAETETDKAIRDEADRQYVAQEARRRASERIADENAPRLNPRARFDPSKGVAERPWLVRRFIPKDTVTMLVGDSHAGKTLAAVDLVAGLVTGTEGWGEALPAGNVLYLAGEGFEHDIPGRLEAWSAHHARKVDWDRLHLFPMDLDLGSPNSVRSVANYVREMDIDLVVLDVLAYAMGSMSVDGNDDTRRAAQALRTIATSSGCSVLALHHPKSGDQSHLPAGNKMWLGLIDQRINIEGDPTSHRKCLRVTKDKANGPGYTLEGHSVGRRTPAGSNPVWVTDGTGW